MTSVCPAGLSGEHARYPQNEVMLVLASPLDQHPSLVRLFAPFADRLPSLLAPPALQEPISPVSPKALQSSSSHSPLSFPTTPLSTPFIFNFPLPTPARHLPPPHPGPRHLVSIQAQPQSLYHAYPDSRRHPTHQPHPQSYHFWSSSLPFSHHLPRSKRRVALPQFHYIRSKKIKRAHSFFRSPALFYPGEHFPMAQNYQLNPSCMIPEASQQIGRNMASPKWLYTSPAAEGNSSNLCPNEAQFTGTSQGWCVLPGATPPSFSPSLNVSHQASPPAKSASFAAPPRMPRMASQSGSQVAPLKAQLLAVLRLRSSLQPGEAALRLRKWVMWNSWVRGHAQRRFYPVVNTTSQLAHSSTPNSLSDDEWTGEEIFDENGDLVCEDEDLDISTAIEENISPAPLAVSKTDMQHPAMNEPMKSQTKTRLELSLRIVTSNSPPNITPPASPESRSHHNGMKNEHHARSPTADVTSMLGQIRVSKSDQKPLTPPPSPPNHTRK